MISRHLLLGGAVASLLHAGVTANTESGFLSHVGGGRQNTASGQLSTVVAGDNNLATALYAFVGGGLTNTAAGEAAAASGGTNNTANALSATVAGGDDNTAEGQYSAIGGGSYNTVSGKSSIVGGGQRNHVTGANAVVVGGSRNTASSIGASIVGGHGNVASGEYSTVGGGSDNVASGAHAVAFGSNGAATHNFSFVFGGSGATCSSKGESTAHFCVEEVYVQDFPLNATLTSHAGLISTASTSISTISNQILELDTTIDGLLVNDTELAAAIAQHTLEIYNHSVQFSETSTRIDRLNASLLWLEAEVANSSESLQAAVDSVTSAVNSLPDLDALQWQVDNNTASIAVVNDTIGIVQSALEEELSTVQDQVSANEASISANTALLASQGTIDGWSMLSIIRFRRPTSLTKPTGVSWSKATAKE